MRDFFKATLLLSSILALILIARVAAFVPLHSDVTAVKDPAPIAAADRGCAVRQVKMPCFRQANREGGAMATVPLQSAAAAAADAGTIAARDTRCAALQVKFPCLQHSDWRS